MRNRIPRQLVRLVCLVTGALPIALGATARIEAQRGQAAPTTPRQAAPVDLAGYWVSVVTEDWRWRMVTPPRGDHPSVPLNAEGARVAGGWDPAKDEAAGEPCRSYGAPGVMRVPGRLRITWEDDDTLRIEAEAGTQTRLFHFGGSPPPVGGPTWQGHSVAQWEYAGGRGGRGGRGRGGRAGPPRGGSLKVVTTHMRPGYLQKNGVPYSGNAVLMEYFHRTVESNGDWWLIVTAIIEDPKYLNQPFLRSTHFKKLPDASEWSPTPCSAR